MLKFNMFSILVICIIYTYIIQKTLRMQYIMALFFLQLYIYMLVFIVYTSMKITLFSRLCVTRHLLYVNK